MGEEIELKKEIEEEAIQLGKTMEQASFLLGYDDMMELVMKSIMSELCVSEQGKVAIVIRAGLQFK